MPPLIGYRLMICDAPGCPNRSQTDNGLNGGAIHEPDNALAIGSVLPQNVRFAVPVEIGPVRRTTTTYHGGTEKREHLADRIRDRIRAAASKEQSDRAR